MVPPRALPAAGAFPRCGLPRPHPHAADPQTAGFYSAHGQGEGQRPSSFTDSSAPGARLGAGAQKGTKPAASPTRERPRGARRTAPGTSVSPSASGSHRDTRATPPVQGPPGRRPRRRLRLLAATCEAAIGHIPLGFPSCAWCRCPTAILGGPTEGPSALRRAHRHMETRRCCWQFLGVIRQRGTVLSAPRAFTCFIPGTTY